MTVVHGGWEEGHERYREHKDGEEERRKELMKELASQAKELSSQWGPMKSLGRVVIRFDLSHPR